MARIHSLQRLDIRWVHNPLYVVSDETLAVADARRSCCICGESFKVGDGMTVAGTDKGNKLMHQRCYEAQHSE